MAKNLFILNDAPYGTERGYNALRLAGALLKRPGYYNIELMLRGVTRHGAEVGVCGTCMDARGIGESELTEGAKRGSLEQLTDWATWADKTLVF